MAECPVLGTKLHVPAMRRRLVPRPRLTSMLTGPVADQAQLHGVLARLRDIGATLLSLNALEASHTPATGIMSLKTQ
jgi:hypothetical protein